MNELIKSTQAHINLEIFKKVHMKKLFILFLFSLLLISCNKDENNTSNKSIAIVGKWNYIKTSADVETSNSKVTSEIEESIMNPFDFDGGYIMFTDTYQYGYYNSIDKKTFWSTYSIKGNVLKVCFVDKYGTAECDEMEFVIKEDFLILVTDQKASYERDYPNVEIKKAFQKLEYRKEK